MIINGKLDTYWSKVGGERLSAEFKDLILRMFSYDGSKRPTVEELREHAWMKSGLDIKKTRSDLLERLSSIRSEKTADSSACAGSSRGDPELTLIRRGVSKSKFEQYKFNDMTDFDTMYKPGEFIDSVEEYNDILSAEGSVPLTFEKNVEK